MHWTARDIERILSAFLRDELGVEDEAFSEESDLFEEGYVDSIHLETFFGFVEDTFRVTLEEEQFFDDRIATVSGIARMVLELRKGEDEKSP